MLRSLLLFSIAVQIFSFDTWGGKRDAQAVETVQLLSLPSAPPDSGHNDPDSIQVFSDQGSFQTSIPSQPPSYEDNKKFFQGFSLEMVKQPERARFLYCFGRKVALKHTKQETDDLSKKIFDYQKQIKENKEALKENKDQLAHLSRLFDDLPSNLSQDLKITQEKVCLMNQYKTKITTLEADRKTKTDDLNLHLTQYQKMLEKNAQSQKAMNRCCNYWVSPSVIGSITTCLSSGIWVILNHSLLEDPGPMNHYAMIFGSTLGIASLVLPPILYCCQGGSKVDDDNCKAQTNMYNNANKIFKNQDFLDSMA